MDKRADRKSHRVTGSKLCRIGTPLGIHDKNGVELCVGDIIRYDKEECIILYGYDVNMYQALLTRSQWYGDNKYDANSYGKAYDIHLDDGARMEIELLKREVA